PFEGTASEVLARVRGDESAPSPFSLNGDVGANSDLELICRKCLEKNPADRYPTAAELADDLERARAGERISLRRRSWVVQLAVDVYESVARAPEPGRPEMIRWSWVDLADAVLVGGFHVSVYFLAAAGASAGWVWLSLGVFLVLWWGVFIYFVFSGPV